MLSIGNSTHSKSGVNHPCSRTMAVTILSLFSMPLKLLVETFIGSSLKHCRDSMSAIWIFIGSIWPGGSKESAGWHTEWAKTADCNGKELYLAAMICHATWGHHYSKLMWVRFAFKMIWVSPIDVHCVSLLWLAKSSRHQVVECSGHHLGKQSNFIFWTQDLIIDFNRFSQAQKSFQLHICLKYSFSQTLFSSLLLCPHLWGLSLQLGKWIFSHWQQLTKARLSYILVNCKPLYWTRWIGNQ